MDNLTERVQRLTLSHRLEKSLVGQALVSAFVTAVLAIGVLSNLPDSEISRAAQPALQPLAVSTGLDQVWRMYAPDPIRTIETLEIHVTLADGSDRVWTFDKGNRALGAFHWYHWQKLKEQAIREPDIRAGFALWAVRYLTTTGDDPVHVQMTFRSEELFPPGKSGSPAVHTETLYERDLNGRP